MLCGICIVHIQPRKRLLDHADDAASTRQHELDHTDHADHESMSPEIWGSLSDLSDVWRLGSCGLRNAIR